MNTHYYQEHPDTPHDMQLIKAHVGGKDYYFQTDTGVFSRSRMDYGSVVLVETVLKHMAQSSGQLLELGSGYGPISIIIADQRQELVVWGIELNERASQLSPPNAERNQVAQIQWIQGDATVPHELPAMDIVVTNPPIRAGKGVIQAFVNQAYQVLKTGGELYVVIQKKQGAPSMRSYMESIFGNVERLHQDKGYWILRSIK